MSSKHFSKIKYIKQSNVIKTMYIGRATTAKRKRRWDMPIYLWALKLYIHIYVYYHNLKKIAWALFTNEGKKRLFTSKEVLLLVIFQSNKLRTWSGSWKARALHGFSKQHRLWDERECCNASQQTSLMHLLLFYAKSAAQKIHNY